MVSRVLLVLITSACAPRAGFPLTSRLEEAVSTGHCAVSLEQYVERSEIISRLPVLFFSLSAKMLALVDPQDSPVVLKAKSPALSFTPP
jgi:hypothetical protein